MSGSRPLWWAVCALGLAAAIVGFWGTGPEAGLVGEAETDTDTEQVVPDRDTDRRSRSRRSRLTPTPARAGTALESDEAPRPSATVVLTVVGDADDRPIFGARAFDLLDDPLPGTSAADGVLTVRVSAIDASDERVDTWVEVRAEGRETESVHVVASPGDIVHETVAMRTEAVVAGTVRDTDGRPIPGVRITAFQTGSCIIPIPEVGSTRSDASGRFRLDGLSSSFGVILTVSDGVHATQVVSRDPRDERPLEVVMRSGGRLTGIVRGPDGLAIAGAHVDARPASGSLLLSVEHEWTTRTDEQGRWTLRGLSLGCPWSVQAEGADLMDSLPVETPALASGEARSVQDLELREPAIVLVDLVHDDPAVRGVARLDESGFGDPRTCDVPGRVTYRLVRDWDWSVTAELDGAPSVVVGTKVTPGMEKVLRVRFDGGVTLTGRVFDDLGAPLNGATVEVDPSSRDARRTTTDAEGRFSFSALSRSIHVLRFQAEGHAGRTVESVDPAASDLSFELPRLGEVEVRVRLPDGGPRPKRRSCHWNDYPNSADTEEAWTDAPVVQTLPPGDYSFTVEVPGYVKWETSRVVVEPGRRTQLPDVLLERGHSVAGRLLDPDGRPVPFENVFLAGEMVTTDAEGRFTSPRLTAGQHEFSAPFVKGALPVDTHFDLGPDTPPLEIRLERGVLLRVRLKVPEERAGDLSETYVRARPADATDDDRDVDFDFDVGKISVRLVRLPPGRWRIVVESPDGEDAWRQVVDRPIVLEAGRDREVDIDLPE